MVAGLLSPPEPLLFRQQLTSVQYVEHHEDAPELTLHFGARYAGDRDITIKIDGAGTNLAACFMGEAGSTFAISIRRKGQYEP